MEHAFIPHHPSYDRSSPRQSQRGFRRSKKLYFEEYEEISEQEREVISRIYGEFRHYKRIELLEYCQGLKEWRAPHGCFVPIETDSILDAAVPFGSRNQIRRKLRLCATEQKKQLQTSGKTKKTGAETPV